MYSNTGPFCWSIDCQVLRKETEEWLHSITVWEQHDNFTISVFLNFIFFFWRDHLISQIRRWIFLLNKVILKYVPNTLSVTIKRFLFRTIRNKFQITLLISNNVCGFTTQPFLFQFKFFIWKDSSSFSEGGFTLWRIPLFSACFTNDSGVQINRSLWIFCPYMLEYSCSLYRSEEWRTDKNHRNFSIREKDAIVRSFGFFRLIVIYF